MARVWTCSNCHKMRARSGEELCPVCWLIGELAREHRDGEHRSGNPNMSCVDCTRAIPRREINVRVADQKTPLPGKRQVPSEPKPVKPPKLLKSGLGSHVDCGHESTPGARAICRRERSQMA